MNTRSSLFFPIKRGLILFRVISGKISVLLSPFLGVPVTKCPLISATDFEIRSLFDATSMSPTMRALASPKMAASIACSSNAAAAVLAYAPAGTSAGQWFLPSQDELNEMWLYSQVVGFNTATYGFASAIYWSSSQYDAYDAWAQYLGTGAQGNGGKANPVRVRPVRAF